MQNGALFPTALIALLWAASLSGVDSFQATTPAGRPAPLRIAAPRPKRTAATPLGGRSVRLPIGYFLEGGGRSGAAFSLAAGGSDDEDAASTTGKVSIVYCTGCRWMLRAAYFAQELLTTFRDDLTSVTLVPSRPPSPGGTFLVTLDGKPVWNRESEGRFPETKELKQRIRDVIAPDRDLGHSDVSGEKKPSAKQDAQPIEGSAGCDECPDTGESSPGSLVHADGSDVGSLIPPHVSIVYCTGCKWMFRAAWYAQEILSTFQEEVNSVSLVPSRDSKGIFTVTLNDETIWDRKAEGRHAEAKELKQRIRDIIAPSRDLGHSDVKPDARKETFEELSDDDAAEQRNFFGVM